MRIFLDTAANQKDLNSRRGQERSGVLETKWAETEPSKVSVQNNQQIVRSHVPTQKLKLIASRANPTDFMKGPVTWATQ